MALGFNHTLNKTVKAGSAVPVKRFFKADGTLCGAGAQAAGVSVSAAAAADDYFGGCLVGLVIVETGATVAVGNMVESDANGKAVVVDTGIPLGQVMEVGTGEAQILLR